MNLADFVRPGGLFVLTGAGMSTESGIPDYRLPDGTRRSIPMTFAEFMATPAARRRYWARSGVGWQAFAAAEPNAGHRALTTLQQAGLVHHVVTQNVDGLHQRAGTTGVAELHGNLANVVCVPCGWRIPRDDFQTRLRELNPHLPERGLSLADGDALVRQEVEDAMVLAVCDRCGSDALKPDVVMFGESVPAERVARQFAELRASRAVLVLGSSLRVMSGYRFVLDAFARELPVALVGLGEMRGQERATLVIHDRLGDTLTALTLRLAHSRAVD